MLLAHPHKTGWAVHCGTSTHQKANQPEVEVTAYHRWL